MGRVEDAIDRAARARKGTDLEGAADPQLPSVRHDNEMRVVAPRHLDRFPLELQSAPVPSPPLAKVPSQQPSSTSSAPDAATQSDRSPVPQEPSPPPPGGEYHVGFSATLAEKLVTMRETNPVAVEQYRKLAANLHQLQLERRSRVVMVASAVASEGKTLTAVNLALTLSESFQQKVLLVDADLRRPQIHSLFQVPVVAGLNEALRSSGKLRLQVFRISPSLMMLPAGSPDPDPMSALTSDRMRRVITEASSAFDWVILDSPPLANLPDAHLLAGMMDLAIVVVAAGRTPYTAIARAVEMLGKERVAGVVLNQVDDSALDTTRRLARRTANGNGTASEEDDRD